MATEALGISAQDTCRMELGMAFAALGNIPVTIVVTPRTENFPMFTRSCLPFLIYSPMTGVAGCCRFIQMIGNLLRFMHRVASDTDRKFLSLEMCLMTGGTGRFISM